jgi:ADP-heptose:LPS heptosyltransferase
VLRALPGVGDLLCAVPALRALRAAAPQAHVTLLGLRGSGWFVRRFAYLVDDLLPVEGVAGLPEVRCDAAAALRFFQRAQCRRFDLAVQAHGSGRVTNPLLTLLGASHQVGAHVPDGWVPPGTSIEYPSGEHEIVRLLRVVAAAGCPPQGVAIDLPVTPTEERAADALLEGAGLRPREFVCLHPGGSTAERCWPAERFAATGTRLARRGLDILVTGSSNERALARRVADTINRGATRPCRARAVDAAGRTNIGTLAALHRRARLVVTNDTGSSHVAAAVRAPSVVVIRASDPIRWAPLDTLRHLPVAAPGTTTGPTPAAVDAAVATQLERW